MHSVSKGEKRLKYTRSFLIQVNETRGHLIRPPTLFDDYTNCYAHNYWNPETYVGLLNKERAMLTWCEKRRFAETKKEPVVSNPPPVLSIEPPSEPKKPEMPKLLVELFDKHKKMSIMPQVPKNQSVAALTVQEVESSQFDHNNIDHKSTAEDPSRLLKQLLKIESV